MSSSLLSCSAMLASSAVKAKIRLQLHLRSATSVGGRPCRWRTEETAMSQSNAPQAQPGGRSHVTLTFNRTLTDDEVEHLKLTTNALDALRVPPVVKAAYARE